MESPVISVIMPTYKQASFIRRAIISLLNQQLRQWELIIINDASPDETEEMILPFLSDKRIRYHKNDTNQGLGFCLNYGIEKSDAPLIAYLPSDDMYYETHLSTLYDTLITDPEAILAYSSLRYNYNRYTDGEAMGEWLQPVQVLHKKNEVRWPERKDLESDNLNWLFWDNLKGKRVHTGELSCEWVDHPHQRYKIMREPIGGINPFRRYYKVEQPLRFHSTRGNYIDEIDRYRAMRNRKDTPPKKNGLKILLVGELAYNADRVLALEEQGNELYGLWIDDPYWYNWVGPLPFGHVKDLSSNNWKEEIKKIKPDIIYSLLNWQVVPFANQVRAHCNDIPFVWHFKEGPFICLEKGSSNDMIELYSKADGRIYVSDEMQWWLEEFITKEPHSLDIILDGDLPKKDWFDVDRSPLLSDKDGAFHTVVPGRPIGLHPENVVELSKQNIHLHFYGDFTQSQWKEWIEKTNRMAPGYLHIHPNVDQENWVKEFSQYDAGWLHYFDSVNQKEIRRCNWDDLNIPARMSTLALSGLPMLQKNNEGHSVATQSLVQQLNLGLFFSSMEELGTLLRQKDNMSVIRDNVWQKRHLFTFDHHVPALETFFRNVIAAFHNKKAANQIEKKSSTTSV